MAIALHLEALPEVHQALVDFAGLGEGRARCFCISGPLRA